MRAARRLLNLQFRQTTLKKIRRGGRPRRTQIGIARYFTPGNAM
jgi:hypothetical protein